MSFYERLQNETQLDREALYQIDFLQRGVAGELSLPEYIGFLSQAYHHVKHTVPLLMACGGRLPERYEWLREAVAEYIEEELGHQRWILNDISACGGDSELVSSSRPAAATELMVAYAYDKINRVNPVGFFGMVQVLEGTSIAVADNAAEAIQASLGLPNKAFSYLKSHGALDVSHVEFFKGLMNRIDDTADQAEIIHSAKMFYRLYGNIFRELGNGTL
ncbi:MAG: iron-containing redox enzyme family protein [Zhongshania sp.]|uniref:TenA family transcriptional regulator n=1 Tax=Zhongshania sp. TaxID=1971902 RepID=UPI00261C3BDA|nr:iron-containing redox enzyme family protein [Zhongshania sp.]MDF1692660.1 iron-containing redox enzyme family protein [Zhongshania sp.]